MPKVSILTNTYPPEFGAASSRWADLAIGLQTAGYQVEVLTAMPNYPSGKIAPAYKGKLFKAETQSGVPVRRHWIFASHSKNKFARFWNMASLALSVWYSLPHLLKKRPDFIFVQNPPPLLSFSAWLFSRFTGAKWVLNISDLWPHAMADLGVIGRGGMFSALEAATTFLLRRADGCLAQSEEIESYVAEKRGRKNLLLYRTGASQLLFTPKNSYCLKADAPIRLIYTGVLGLAHGMASLCQHVHWPSCHIELHIFGDGLEKEAIANYSALPKANNGIALHEPVPAHEVAQLLPTFDFALISQKNYVFGTVPSKMYEAMMAGVPILYIGEGEGKKIVESSQCGITAPPGDWPSIEKKLRLLGQSTEQQRAQMGTNGRKTAIKFFDRQQQIDRLVKLLQHFEK